MPRLPRYSTGRIDWVDIFGRVLEIVGAVAFLASVFILAYVLASGIFGDGCIR